MRRVDVVIPCYNYGKFLADCVAGALKRCADMLPNAAEFSDMVHHELAEEALRAAARAYDRRRTDTVPVEKLIAFAFDRWPDAASLSTYRSLHTHLTHMPARRLTEGTP